MRKHSMKGGGKSYKKADFSGPSKAAGKIDSIMGAEYRSPLQRKGKRGR